MSEISDLTGLPELPSPYLWRVTIWKDDAFRVGMVRKVATAITQSAGLQGQEIHLPMGGIGRYVYEETGDTWQRRVGFRKYEEGHWFQEYIETVTDYWTVCDRSAEAILFAAQEVEKIFQNFENNRREKERRAKIGLELVGDYPPKRLP